MAGPNHSNSKSSHHHHHHQQNQNQNHNKPSSSSSHRKSRWESAPNPKSGDSSIPTSNTPNKTNPSPKPTTNPSPSNPPPIPDPASLGPPPPPAYGFHMLERRTIVLADGNVRSYFALPPDYPDFQHFPLPGMDRRFAAMSPEGFREDQFAMRARHQDYWNSLGLDGRAPPAAAEGSMKRKYPGEDWREENDEFGRQRKQLLQYGGGGGNNSSPVDGSSSRRDEFRSSKTMRIANVGFQVDQDLLKKAFLHFSKLVNENAAERQTYLDHRKQQGPLKCIACGRSSKDFPDMHGLIMHTYHSDNADLRVDHLGLHKALCVLMGWNYSKPPDNSKVYQFLPAGEAAANQDDLIIWPPVVIVHNTITGKGRDGRMEGLGNKAMDNKFRELGFSGGKSKSLYGRDGHLGITLVKFSGDQSGLKDAMRLADYFERDNHGRKSWAQVLPAMSGKDDEKNPNLVKVDERTGEKTRILYGHLGTAADLDKVDFDTRKKSTIESRREQCPPR